MPEHVDPSLGCFGEGHSRGRFMSNYALVYFPFPQGRAYEPPLIEPIKGFT